MNKLTLYQATELAKLENHVDPETGEIDIEAFNNSKIVLKDKQQAIVAYIKNQKIAIDMLEAALKDLEHKRKVLKNRHDSLNAYLLKNMIENDITEIVANDFTFSAKRKLNPHNLVIDNPSVIPKEFFVYPEPHPNVSLIKEHLANGKDILGVHLEQGERVDIK